MIIIQQYKSKDGKIFDTEQECINYELVLEQVNKIISTLDKKEFQGDEGYIQHPKGTYKFIEAKLVELSNEWFKGQTFKEFDYILGRYIDDSNMNCLSKLSYLLMCTDPKTDKEYGQPYYCLNQDKAKNVKLN